MPSPKKGKISKHGTLGQADVSGAVPIQVSQVVENCQNSNLQDFFGLAGELPPKTAQEHVPRFKPYYQITDEKTGDAFLALKRPDYPEKGCIELEDVPAGQYKIELSLPKDLNSNIFMDVGGAIIGPLVALGAEKEKQREVISRGIPNYYLEATVRVVGRKYGVLDEKVKLDLGTMPTFQRVCKIKESEAPARIEIMLKCHSHLKRIRVAGQVSRRELIETRENPKEISQRNLIAQSKALVQRALQSDIEKQKQNRNRRNNATSIPGGFVSNRLDSDVDLREMVELFYEEFAPQKVSMTDRVLDHFTGRVDEMIFSFEMKYGVQFNRRGRARLIS